MYAEVGDSIIVDLVNAMDPRIVQSSFLTGGAKKICGTVCMCFEVGDKEIIVDDVNIGNVQECARNNSLGRGQLLKIRLHGVQTEWKDQDPDPLLQPGGIVRFIRPRAENDSKEWLIVVFRFVPRNGERRRFVVLL